PRLAHEGPGDDAADRMLALEDLPGDLAHLVQLLHGYDLLMGGDLENAVGRRVDDGLAGAHVLLAQLIDDGSAGGGLVAQHPASDGGRKGVDYFTGKPVGIDGKRPIEDDAGQFPVTRRRVLARGLLGHAAKAPDGRRIRRHAWQIQYMPKPKPAQVGQVEAPHRQRRIAQRIAPFVPKAARVRQLPDADAVEDDQSRASTARHSRHLLPFAPEGGTALRPCVMKVRRPCRAPLPPLQDRGRLRRAMAARGDRRQPPYSRMRATASMSTGVT